MKTKPFAAQYMRLIFSEVGYIALIDRMNGNQSLDLAL